MSSSVFLTSLLNIRNFAINKNDLYVLVHVNFLCAELDYFVWCP
jgi:hypothetical protein